MNETRNRRRVCMRCGSPTLAIVCAVEARSVAGAQFLDDKGLPLRFRFGCCLECAEKLAADGLNAQIAISFTRKDGPN